MSHASLRRVGWAGRGIGLVILGGAFSAAAATPYLNMTGGPLVDQLVGAQTTADFIFSASAGSITVDSAGLSGQNAASYSISKNTCVSGAVLTPTATCEIDVIFAPQQAGALTEALALGTSAGAQTFDISANGLLANLLVSPTQMDFGFQPIGTTSATRTLTFKNPNPIAVNVPTDANTPLGDFYPASGSCETIAANGSCSYQIQWTPITTGVETGNWYVVVGVSQQGDEDTTTQVSFTGSGVQDGDSSVSLDSAYNTTGIAEDGAKITGGGLDGAGNVYSDDFFTIGATWSGQSFQIGSNVNNAVRAAKLSLPSGPYYGVTLLATGVNGNQANQAFTVTYSDGSTAVIHQSLSDWKTPQHYMGESIAVTTAYRLNVDGSTHTGPYYLYAYTLPFDHTKTAVSLTLPNTKNVAVLAVNVAVSGVPVTADLSSLYNVRAVGVDAESAVGTGIDQHGNAISLFQLDSVPLNELLLAVPAYNQPDAVANVTVPLPSGDYSTLQLDGMAVNGNLATQTLTINYQDGTSTAVTQGFSDWHTSQKYSRESIAVAMTYKLNPDGTQHPGTYNVYQYDIPIDATKLVSSVVLPKTSNVVILSVALKP